MAIRISNSTIIDDSRNIVNAGVTTVTSVSIGNTQVISSARQLQNIASLDATTTATIESAIQNAPNTFNDLQITGVSTFTNGPVLVGGATSTGTAGQVLQVAGINSSAYIGGNLGIGITRPTSTLQVVGNVSISGVTTSVTLSATSGTITNISGTAGTITTLNATSGTITNISGTAGTITTLNATSGTITNISGTAGTITTLNATSGTITNLTTTNLSVGVITGTTLNTGAVGSQTSGILTTTASTVNQVLDSLPTATFQTARYQVSIACTGQLVGSAYSSSSASVGTLSAGQFYVPGTYNNVALTIVSGPGNDARANITVPGTAALVGLTSAYNILVTNAAHGIGTNQPVSFASSFFRAAYVSLVEGDIFYTPVRHGIGSSEAVSFASSVFDSAYTGIAVTAGTTYYATGTGTTTFTIQYSIGGSQVTGIGTTTFDSPGNRASLPGVAVTAGTVYYATGTGSTTLTLASQSTGIGTIVGIAISTGLSIGATISGGVSNVVIVSPGSGYNTSSILSASASDLGSAVGTGFSFTVSRVVRNFQSTDVMILQSVGSAATACDYVEYASIANNEILGSFNADISGTNARLLFSPTYRNNTIKYVRTGIVT